VASTKDLKLPDNRPPIGAGPTIVLQTRSVEEVEFLQYVLERTRNELLREIAFTRIGRDEPGFQMADAVTFWIDSTINDHNIQPPTRRGAYFQ
jgi:hypothetical protein